MKFFQARNKNIIERSNYDVSLSNCEKKGQWYKNQKSKNTFYILLTFKMKKFLFFYFQDLFSSLKLELKNVHHFQVACFSLL